MITFSGISLLISFIDEYPSIMVQRALMISYIATIGVEILDFIFLNLINIKNLISGIVSSISSSKGSKKPKKINNEYSILYYDEQQAPEVTTPKREYSKVIKGRKRLKIKTKVKFSIANLGD